LISTSGIAIGIAGASVFVPVIGIEEGGSTTS